MMIDWNEYNKTDPQELLEDLFTALQDSAELKKAKKAREVLAKYEYLISGA